eukprot:scaffold15375_cov26-Tisochrysis_lutea.AAC.1
MQLQSFRTNKYFSSRTSDPEPQPCPASLSKAMGDSPFPPRKPDEHPTEQTQTLGGGSDETEPPPPPPPLSSEFVLLSRSLPLPLATVVHAPASPAQLRAMRPCSRRRCSFES